LASIACSFADLNLSDVLTINSQTTNSQSTISLAIAARQTNLLILVWTSFSWNGKANIVGPYPSVIRGSLMSVQASKSPWQLTYISLIVGDPQGV